MLYLGDCAEILPKLDSESVDSLVTDPPAGISFMSKGWDSDRGGRARWVEWLGSVLAECHRVLKPGAHGLIWALPRTSHWTMCATENAGFEIRDVITHLFGSGFPKSHDISKAIDKAAGAEREVVGKAESWNRPDSVGGDAARMNTSPGEYDITAPATDAAKQWQGYGTALKPAAEFWILCRKPLIGTVAANVLEHGTGGLNIDAARVATDETWSTVAASESSRNIGGAIKLNGCRDMKELRDLADKGVTTPTGRDARKILANVMDHGRDRTGAHTQGRFPPNLILTQFRYESKISSADRHHGLDGTLTVNYSLDHSDLEGQSCRDVSMELVQLLRKVTSGSTAKWNIDEFGESITGQCPRDSLYTTLTVLKTITESKISNWLMHLRTSGSMEDAKSEAGDGGSPAESAENLSQSKPSTTNVKTVSVHGVRPAALKMLTKITDAESWKPMQNRHATVKNTQLMRWLCRLITPPGGVILDPFMGSGSTGKAAAEDGFDFVGIEQDPESFATAQQRLHRATAQGLLC